MPGGGAEVLVLGDGAGPTGSPASVLPGDFRIAVDDRLGEVGEQLRGAVLAGREVKQLPACRR